MNPVPLLCNRCLSVIGHGLLAEHGNSIGGVVELDGHECPRELGETG